VVEAGAAFGSKLRKQFVSDSDNKRSNTMYVDAPIKASRDGVGSCLLCLGMTLPPFSVFDVVVVVVVVPALAEFWAGGDREDPASSFLEEVDLGVRYRSGTRRASSAYRICQSNLTLTLF
jgi:hypothetical protein